MASGGFGEGSCWAPSGDALTLQAGSRMLAWAGGAHAPGWSSESAPPALPSHTVAWPRCPTYKMGTKQRVPSRMSRKVWRVAGSYGTLAPPSDGVSWACTLGRLHQDTLPSITASIPEVTHQGSCGGGEWRDRLGQGPRCCSPDLARMAPRMVA